MKSLIIRSEKAQDTLQLAKKIARKLKKGNIVCLHGDLGAGKTTFVQGAAEALKVKKNKVHSPTFTLLNMYEGQTPVYHFDLYRLDSAGDIYQIGYEEFMYGDGIALVEWADKLDGLYPDECLKVSLEHQGENKRRIVCEAHGKEYVTMLEGLKK